MKIAFSWQLHGFIMAIELFWGSGSPYSWRVLLALEFKRLRYESRLLDLSKLEHRSADMLKLNPRGRVMATLCVTSRWRF
jgi:Glutathione S-transferase, N-terminal domain